MRRIAIIGGGPRGLSALENLFIELTLQEKEKKVIVSLFETSENPGSGNVWNTQQLKTNWLNISERALKDLKSRDKLNLDGLNIADFPSYTDWLPEEERHPDANTPDRFPERSKMGTYLNERFNSIAIDLQMEGFLKIIRSEVINIDFKDEIFSLKASDNFYEFEEILLTIGHQPTKISKQLKKWKLHEKSNSKLLVLEEPYPAKNIIASDKINSSSTVAIRGFGLAMIDVIRALTIGKGGEFNLTNTHTFQSKFISNEDVPKKIIAFSLDGEPLVPKPLNANIDANFEPTKQEIETFGIIISKNASAAEKVLDHSFLVKAIAKISARIYIDLDDKAIANKLQQKELESIIINWLEDAKFQHALIVPSSKKVTLKIKEFIKMALGKEQFSLDYCVGQVWRHLQPTLYEKFSHSKLPETVIAMVIDLDERMKRYSYGPPIESMQQLLSLVDAEILDLDLVEDPEITEVKNGWNFEKNSIKCTAQIMINSVLDAPKIKNVSSPLICNLLSNDLIEPIHSNLGIKTHENACIEISEEKKFIPLAVLGRLSKGSVIGVDAILECFGPRVKDWAKDAVKRV